MYDSAKQIVALQKKIEKTFLENEKKDEHCITIAASTIPAQYLLPEILVKFNEKYPNEQFKVIETDSAKVVEEVLNHTVDIGFTGTVIDKKHCKYVPFYQDELIIIAPNNEKFRKLQETSSDTRWILQEPLIMREEGSGTRKEAEKQLKKSGVEIGRLNIVASMENQEAIKKSVSNGMGVSIIPDLRRKKKLRKEQFWDFHLQKKMEREISTLCITGVSVVSFVGKICKDRKRDLQAEGTVFCRKWGNENDLYG